MPLLTELRIFIGSIFYKYAAPTALLIRRCRGGRRFGRARDGRVFFHMAGGGPGGEFGGIVFVDVGHDGFEDVQGDGGLMRGVRQSAGGSGLTGEGAAFGGDVRIEQFELLRQFQHLDEAPGEQRGVFAAEGAAGVVIGRRVGGEQAHRHAVVGALLDPPAAEGPVA